MKKVSEDYEDYIERRLTEFGIRRNRGNGSCLVCDDAAEKRSYETLLYLIRSLIEEHHTGCVPVEKMPSREKIRQACYRYIPSLVYCKKHDSISEGGARVEAVIDDIMKEFPQPKARVWCKHIVWKDGIWQDDGINKGNWACIISKQWKTCPICESKRPTND